MRFYLFGEPIEFDMLWTVSDIVKDEEGNTVSFRTTPIDWVEPDISDSLLWED